MAMDMFTMSLIQVALALLGLSRPIHAQAIGSFFHGRGSGVVVHNPDAGNFLYSIDSDNGYGDLLPLNVTAVPRNETPIACTGYGSPSSVYGSAFYQTTNSSLVQLIFKVCLLGVLSNLFMSRCCNYASGICVNYGEYIISSNVTIPVSPNTQLTAALFPTRVGYRVTYQDTQGSLRQLAYANSSQEGVTSWADGNLTGNFTIPDGYAFDTTTLSPTNVTEMRETLYAVDEGDVKVSNSMTRNSSSAMTIRDAKSWSAGPSIPALPSFIPSLTHIATLTYHNWDCLFYIDNNSHLQFMRSTDGGLKWSLQPQMSLSSWPKADTPNAHLSASTSNNLTSYPSAYIFYKSGGKLIQARITNETWEDAEAIRMPGSSHTGLKTKIKIGAATGGSVTFLLALGMLWYQRHRAQRAREIPKEDSIYGVKDNGSSEYGFVGFKAELPGLPAERAELDHDPDCLLLHQLQSAMRRGELCGENRREELNTGFCTCEMDGVREMVYELASPVSELDTGEHGYDGDRKIDVVASEKEVAYELEDVVVCEKDVSLVQSTSYKEAMSEVREVEDDGTGKGNWV
ncbi:hypothetical protein VTL71DRAFT_13234 [Oculimacula yallundae]|uniref:Uncharacterized protein n=1 Tax=Oculimacula yallundae TaxID=86028 RepID=A0ABR4CLW2_9HELO